jgi:hypothetical protein
MTERHLLPDAAYGSNVCQPRNSFVAVTGLHTIRQQIAAYETATMQIYVKRLNNANILILRNAIVYTVVEFFS